MSVFILAKNNPDNKNFYDENGILETEQVKYYPIHAKRKGATLENAQGEQPEIIRII